ncbi:MAG: alanine racemase [Tepidiformaceae bacterium]
MVLHPSSDPSRSLAAVTRERNAWLEIDLDAAASNATAVKAWVGMGVELIAVVKANAYGHGIAGIAPAIEAQVDRYAVVWPAEALTLRALGVRKPVLVLGHAFPGDAADCVTRDITLTVHSLALGAALSAAATAAGRTAKVHVKVDTGLHRFGLALDEVVALAQKLRALPGIEVEGLWTHMANADEADDSFSEHQHAIFGEAVRLLPWIPYRHTANSAGALRRAELRYEGVRTGLSLRGLLPPNTPGPTLRPVLALKARLARVHDIAAGEGVSYGLTWRAAAPARIALVPVGYADGWKRQLGNRGHVLVGGLPCPVVGKVAMDQFMADVTAVPGAAEGDEAVLIGTQGGHTITADDVAEAAGTISWDVLASLGARLPRLHHRGGHVVLEE